MVPGYLKNLFKTIRLHTAKFPQMNQFKFVQTMIHFFE